MLKKVLPRLLQMLITVVGVSFLTFSLTYLAPGDPAMMLLEAGDTIVSQETIDQTRKELGLDKPFLVQYGNWAVNALQGDMGISYSAKNLLRKSWLRALLALCCWLQLPLCLFC